LNKVVKYNLLIFIFYPALGLVTSFKNYKTSSSKNILWAFIVFFGFTFAISKESNFADINRYINEFSSLYAVPMTTANALEYYDKSGELDIVQSLLAITLSRISDSPALLTTVYAIILGFFYSRNIYYLLNQLSGRLSKWTWLLIIIYILIVPFWFINGFRFWTATHIFIYGILPFLYEGKRNRLVFVGLAVLFHFSYIIPLVSVITFFIVPKRLNFLILVYIGTIIYNEINVQWLSDYIESTDQEKVIERTSIYIDQERVEAYRQGETSGAQQNWYVRWYKDGLNYMILLAFILIYRGHKKRKILTRRLFTTFAYALWFYSFANVLNTIPSGGRFLFTAQLISFFVIIILFQNDIRKMFSKYLFPSFLPAMLLFIVVSMREGFYYLSVATVFGNPITAIISFGEYVALNDLIK